MLAVGLTGSAFSGKSTVARLMKDLGARTLDADRIVHALMRKGTPEHRAIVKRFGEGVLGKAGEISRPKLRELALGQADGLRSLEKILHPAVRRVVGGEFKKHAKFPGLIVVEVPLLFESGMDRLMDRTVAVTATWKLRAGFASKRGVSTQVLEAFAGRQWPQERKAASADFVILNDGSLDNLHARVKQTYGRLLKFARV